MTSRSSSLCTVSYCPEPSNPDWHICLVCRSGSSGIHHHHVWGRGKTLTLNKQYVVPLCQPHHDKVTLNEWGDGIFLIPVRGGRWLRVYRVWDIHNNTIAERELGPESMPDTGLPEPGPSRPSERVSGDVEIPAMMPGIDVPSLAALPGIVAHLKRLGPDQLAEYSAFAQRITSHAYMIHCAAVYIYREQAKPISGAAWSDDAGKLFGFAGRTMRRDALFCERLLARLETATDVERELIVEVTDRQLRVVAQATNFDAALDEAVAYRADTGRSEPTGLAGRLQAVGLLPASRYSYQCPSCGRRGRLTEFRQEEPIGDSTDSGRSERPQRGGGLAV